jgi:hypothetical protein
MKQSFPLVKINLVAHNFLADNAAELHGKRGLSQNE